MELTEAMRDKLRESPQLLARFKAAEPNDTVTQPGEMVFIPLALPEYTWVRGPTGDQLRAEREGKKAPLVGAIKGIGGINGVLDGEEKDNFVRIASLTATELAEILKIEGVRPLALLTKDEYIMLSPQKVQFKVEHPVLNSSLVQRF